MKKFELTSNRLKEYVIARTMDAAIFLKEKNGFVVFSLLNNNK